MMTMTMMMTAKTRRSEGKDEEECGQETCQEKLVVCPFNVECYLIQVCAESD